MKNLVLLVLSLLTFEVITAQSPSLLQAEDSLQQLAITFMSDTAQDKRIKAADAFLPLLENALKNPLAFEYPFDSLSQVSIQYPADSSFRVFSWQLYVDMDDYRYFGLIQMKDAQLPLYTLHDGSGEVDNPDYDILNPDNWYGAVYYNLKAFDTPDGTQYLLFGYDGYQFFDKRKIVDVLRFRDGSPVFGSPVFAKVEEGRGPITQNRLVREYSAAAAIKCNFDSELNLIILDHMAPIRRPDGQGMSMIPDGTYEGYRYREDGLWVYEEKLFHEMLDTAPIPKPVLNKDKKDLFGN